MLTHDDIRRIALALPGTIEEPGAQFAIGVPVKGKVKGLVWAWLERVHPKKARVPSDAVVAVRVSDLVEKDLLINAEPHKYFTEAHYNGYPAVLVRLAEVSADDIEPLLRTGWRSIAESAPRTSRKKRG
jgi:hypothetical protein